MQGRLGAREGRRGCGGFPPTTQAPESNWPAMGSENSLLRLDRSLERPARDFRLLGWGSLLAALPLPLAASSCVGLLGSVAWIPLVCLGENTCTRDQTDRAQVERSKRAKHSARRVRSTWSSYVVEELVSAHLPRKTWRAETCRAPRNSHALSPRVGSVSGRNLQWHGGPLVSFSHARRGQEALLRSTGRP